MLTEKEQKQSAETDDSQITAFWTPETMSQEHIHDLVIDLIPSEEIRKGRNIGLHVINNDDPHADIARYTEWKVFLDAFGNDMDTMEEEYGPYDDGSTFLLVLDYEKEQPAAVLRLMTSNGKIGLKTINDLLNPDVDKNPWYNPSDTETSLFNEIGVQDQSHLVDIGTMGVMPEYRAAHTRDAVSAVLYSSCVRWSLENDYNYWVTIVDERILTMMQDWGKPFLEFDGKGFESYLDSKRSRPMHLEVYSGLQKVKAFDEGVYDLYTKGTGLDNKYVLPGFILPESM